MSLQRIKTSFFVSIVTTLMILTCYSSNAIALAQSSNQAAESDTGDQDGVPGIADASVTAREYHLKAAFLRYVAKFVEWPALTSESINICILGLIPSFEAINTINGKMANDRPITISRISNINEAQGKCQLVFITKTEEDRVKDIIKSIGDLPILDFGDMEHFAEKGGDMNFYILNNRLAIMINPPAVEKSKLKISDRMLKVVTVVPPIQDNGTN